MPKKTIVIAAVLLLIGWQAWRISRDSGAFVEIEPVSVGACTMMEGPAGSEDINIDRVNRVAFISAGNGREVFDSYRSGSTAKVKNGDIWLLDLSQPDSRPEPLNVQIEQPFHPHGIDLLQLEDGKRELYMVNHPSRFEDEILVFDVAEDHSLTLKGRFHYPELISPNDIKAIGRNQFFVSNDHGSPQPSIMATIEDYFGMSWSSVSYFDGQTGVLAVEGIKGANGLAISEDGQTLFIAEALGRSVKRFRRGASMREWEFVEKLDVNTAVDNLEWSEDGRLLAGAHPKLFPLLEHVRDANSLSPSHVIAVQVSSSPMTFETIYMNDGTELSGSSVATMLDGEMLIGSILEDHFLRCEVE
ncbi:hypothetical protein [Pyruvatibacter sp.]|uniref:hypothetical protein n=1 Tax=Pyruvatibacter sp. TaxID=1981328 RepID=UPI0032EB23EF